MFIRRIGQVIRVIIIVMSVLIAGCGNAEPTDMLVSQDASALPKATSTHTSSGNEGEQISIPTESATPPLTDSGGMITFASERDGALAIHVMNVDGSDQRRLTNFGDMEAYPDWSPDGKQIAFHAHHSSKVWSIHVMNSDGSNRQRLTDNVTWDAAPVWSPDGTQIAFTRDGDIWVMNPDGSDQRQLTTDPADDNIADWSSDGAQMAFYSNRDGNYEIYVIATDGTDLRRLTNNNADDWWPDWSPDSSQIAFKTNRDGNFEIYVINADGTNLRRLTDNSAEDGEPDWSPDGTQIAFESNRDGNFEIYVMNSDGTDPRRLTENLARDMMPAWQPSPKADEADELRILFIGNSHIFTNDLPGTFAELARAGGHEVSVDSLVRGGYALEQYVADGSAQTKLNDGPWDFVILQESTLIFAEESERNARMAPAVRSLAESIEQAGGQTVLAMMWATSQAINQNELESFSEAQAQAAASTFKMAEEVNGLVAPVGIAWENAMLKTLDFKLWTFDKVHATPEGTYLMACVLYNTIYQQSSEGLNATAGLPEEMAQFLQWVAAE
ncbi:MAG: hypothetical protein GY832_34205 [Chloroflexi bacterium]|nr:hypothetical protein [Chloroflexota bacterium]